MKKFLSIYNYFILFKMKFLIQKIRYSFKQIFKRIDTLVLKFDSIFI
jgi:hypothetical protein